MKKNDDFLLLFLIVVLVFGIIAYSFLDFLSEKSNEGPMLAPPPVIAPPTTCSNESIKVVWESAFEESFSDTYVVWNTSRSDVCENYYAWKETAGGIYLLAGKFFQVMALDEEIVYSNHSEVSFIWGNYTSALDRSDLLLTSSQIANDYHIEQVGSLLEDAQLIARNWTGAITPQGAFDSKFRFSNNSAYSLQGIYSVFSYYDSNTNIPGGSNFSYIYSNGARGLVHINNQTTYYSSLFSVEAICTPSWTCTNWGACNGSVQNRSCVDVKNCGTNYQKLPETQSCSLGCVSNWVAVNGPCNSTTETFVIWYNDTNRCVNATKANDTGYCDYNNNGIIGKLTEISEVNLDIVAIEISGIDVNYTKNYTGEKDIEIIEETEDDVEIVRVAFEYDFDDAPLNLKKIGIEKQEGDDDFGYLIVEGLNVDNKEFRVDKIEGSNSICVKDRSNVDEIGDISDDCEASDEEYVRCPGRTGGFNCSDGGDGTYLVRGLDNSGVRELDFTITSPPITSPNPPAGCQQIWDCPAVWNACVGGIQSRTCVDLSACTNVSKTKNETRTCTGTGCTPDWDCGPWEPADCEAGEEQTQECIDSNNCETDKTKTRDCSKESSINWIMIVSVIAAGIVVVAAIIIIVVLKGRRDARLAEERNNSFSSMQRPPAGTFNPTHYGGPPPGGGFSGGYNPGINPAFRR